MKKLKTWRFPGTSWFSDQSSDKSRMTEARSIEVTSNSHLPLRNFHTWEKCCCGIEQWNIPLRSCCSCVVPLACNISRKKCKIVWALACWLALISRSTLNGHFAANLRGGLHPIRAAYWSSSYNMYVSNQNFLRINEETSRPNLPVFERCVSRLDSRWNSEWSGW